MTPPRWRSPAQRTREAKVVMPRLPRRLLGTRADYPPPFEDRKPCWCSKSHRASRAVNHSDECREQRIVWQRNQPTKETGR
jgi:hypothetical protein